MLEDLEGGDTVFDKKCRIKDIARALNGDCVLTLTVPKEFFNVYDSMADKDLRIKLCLWRNKRSLDANNYFWELCGELAAKLKISPRDIYRILVKEVGGNFQVTPITDDAVEAWIANWESRGIGWVCEVVGKSKFEGYTNVINYFGSSSYDSAQMSRLIELVITECKNNGIETETPRELSLIYGDGV